MKTLSILGILGVSIIPTLLGGCDSNTAIACTATSCDTNATCDASKGEIVCTCKTGFEGDGHVCADIDGCASNPCFSGVACTDVAAPGTGFTCGPCPTGFAGDGLNCTDIDECALPGVTLCGDNATCTNIANGGGYACACNTGYEGDGQICTDIDECTAGTHNCDTDPEACVNLDGSYRCECPVYYTGSGIGDHGCIHDDCFNQMLDEHESDVDCGGALCPLCAAPLHCNSATDCESANCINGSCALVFDYSGGSETFTVPSGVTSLTIRALGAEGASCGSISGAAGKGGLYECQVSVTEGDVLTIQVGGQGSCSAGGYNGGASGGHCSHASCDDVNDARLGGGGGGASDVRLNGDRLLDRICVAGGGGGGGGSAGVTWYGGAGGAGGGGLGDEGGDDQTYVNWQQGGTGGGGGTQSGGGKGGVNPGYATPGMDGSEGNGGSGPDGSGSDSVGHGGGGGGGGGYFGGGGGSAGNTQWGRTGGGGGGGGSGYTNGTLLNAENGVQSGHGRILIGW